MCPPDQQEYPFANECFSREAPGRTKHPNHLRCQSLDRANLLPTLLRFRSLSSAGHLAGLFQVGPPWPPIKRRVSCWILKARLQRFELAFAIVSRVAHLIPRWHVAAISFAGVLVSLLTTIGLLSWLLGLCVCLDDNGQ
jgi:hypothetical protein